MLGRTLETRRDSSDILSDLVPFVAGGFKALAGMTKASGQKSGKRGVKSHVNSTVET